VERITAGYLMNTFDFSRFRLIAGLRIEGTQDKTVSFDTTDLTPLGLVQAGFFYKLLISPIVSDLVPGSTTCPTGFKPCTFNTPLNAGSASIYGVEVGFIQHFTYLPGLLGGLSISANYSRTTSHATGVDPLRTDKPALLRQAPDTWNISPTFDRGRISIRVGLAYNGRNIFSYAYRNLQRDPNDPSGLAIIPITPTPPINGPAGDLYRYPHLQVDAQGSFRIRRGLQFTAAGLNLTNEVFGFYNGSNPFFIQREYYKPTFTFGFRWETFAGKE
jgi:outer membrane receptor protein involved in Fe transport